MFFIFSQVIGFAGDISPLGFTTGLFGGIFFLPVWKIIYNIVKDAYSKYLAKLYYLADRGEGHLYGRIFFSLVH